MCKREGNRRGRCMALPLLPSLRPPSVPLLPTTTVYYVHYFRWRSQPRSSVLEVSLPRAGGARTDGRTDGPRWWERALFFHDSCSISSRKESARRTNSFRALQLVVVAASDRTEDSVSKKIRRQHCLAESNNSKPFPLSSTEETCRVPDTWLLSFEIV